MNTLTLPPSPNWYEAEILGCAPDNTLIFGARNDIVILENKDTNSFGNVRIVARAHTQKILSVNINKSWGQPHKLVVSVSDDKIVKIWDVDSGKKLHAHNEHLSHNKVIGATFAGEDRVISISEDGIIVIWSVALNQTRVLKDLFGTKVTITCLSSCPHATWLMAFGLKSGLVVVADLRKQGKVLHRMRGHDKAVLSLAWCPVPINIFPKNPHNYVGQKRKMLEQDSTNIIPSDGIQDKTDADINDLKLSKNNEPLLSSSASDGSNKKLDETISEELLVSVKDELKEVINLNEPNEKEIANKLNETPELISACGIKSEAIKKETKLSGIITKLKEETKDYEKEIDETQTHIKTEVENESEEVPKTEPTVDCKSTQSEQSEEAAEEKQAGPTETTNETEEVPKTEPNVDCESTQSEQSEEGTDVNQAVSVDDMKMNSNAEDENHINKNKMDESKIKTCSDVGRNIVTKTVCEEVMNSNGEDENKINKNKMDESKIETCSDVGRNIVTKVACEEIPQKEFLLATSAREGSIYIWRAGTDGRMQTFLTIPNKSGNRKYKSAMEKLWITLCWVSPTVLLSSSKSSELLAWTLPKPQNDCKQFTVIHNDHSALLFSIAAPIVLLNELNWKESTKTNAWTTSQDRLLLNTSISSERTNLSCYPTLGGSVQSLQLSPLDPNRLAISTSDGFIKIWDLSRPHKNSVIMTNFYQKIQSKVSAIAWHPVNELLLAFGTTEGRVGYVDTNNKSKTPVLLPQYFKSEVYKIEWAPIDGNKENFGLYAVGEGRLVLFDIVKSPKDPIEVDKPDNTFIYSVCWKPDYSQLFLTTKTGFIIVYSPDLKILCKHYFQYRINDIVWHPNAAIAGSNKSNWFATISNAKTVIVYNFNVESGDNDNNIINTYQGSSDVINSIAWSPYDPTQLVIACELGIAQVWNVEKNQILHTFVNPNFEGILSAIWSPVDPDFMISGAKDNALRIWKISEHPPVDEKEIVKSKNKAIKEMTSETNHLLPKSEQSVENAKGKKQAKCGLLPSYYIPKTTTQAVCDLKKLLLWKDDPSAVEATIGDNCEIDILNIFGTDQDMINLVTLNELVHRQKGKYNLNTMLSLFRGDISTAIKEAIEEKRVNLTIIGLAPMVSPKLWLTACETYANQLSEESDSDPLEIATYYLACHKIQKALDSLCDAFLFREALALAKCRLLGEEVVKNIIEKWGAYAAQTGNFEVAAQCYIFLGKFEDAASVLFRRTDLEILHFAMELAEKVGNEELYKAISFRYNVFKDASDAELPSKVEAVLSQSIKKTDILVKTEGEKVDKLSKPEDVDTDRHFNILDNETVTKVESKNEDVLQSIPDELEGIMKSVNNSSEIKESDPIPVQTSTESIDKSVSGQEVITEE